MKDAEKGEKNDHENVFYLQYVAGPICVFDPVCIVSFSISCRENTTAHY